jgi:hypothetical protein
MRIKLEVWYLDQESKDIRLYSEEDYIIRDQKNESLYKQMKQEVIYIEKKKEKSS